MKVSRVEEHQRFEGYFKIKVRQTFVQPVAGTVEQPVVKVL